MATEFWHEQDLPILYLGAEHHRAMGDKISVISKCPRLFVCPLESAYAGP
jgi:hypothetical protein